MQLEDKAGNAAFSLRKLYESLLMPFDEHCKKRAEGGFGLLGQLNEGLNCTRKSGLSSLQPELPGRRCHHACMPLGSY